MDAGIRVSPKAREGLSGELLPDLSPLSGNSLDAVLITHAHADHIGAVPLVLGAKPHTPVYATPATIALTEVMLTDALRLMGSRLEAEGELPSYDEKQFEALKQAMQPVNFRQPFFIGGKVRVQYFQAGHIPGAASVFLESGDGSLLISGDLSFSPMRATPQAEVPSIHPQVLILETTYGGKLHANRRAEEMRLIASVKRVTDAGGRVLIPAFALGRAQEVALILDAAVANKQLPEIPIYLDGMTRSIAQVFGRFPDYLSPELKKFIEENSTLWRSESVHFVTSREERETMAATPQPSVIIASSGMLTGGASPVYARYIVKESNSAIFITGYQDEESPGKRLQNLAEKKGGHLLLEGKKYEVRCEVGTYSLSAHADENELTQYAAQLDPEWVWLVHGDTEARERMLTLLRERNLRVRLPELGEVVEPSLQKKKSFASKSGLGQNQDLNAETLWHTLHQHEMTGTPLDLDTLMIFWFGETQADKSELVTTLSSQPLYFAASGDQRYRIFSPAQVEQRRERLGWLAEVGDLTHRLILMKAATTNALYLAVGRGQQDDRLLALTKSQLNTNLPLDRVAHVGGVWVEELSDDKTVLEALQKVLDQQQTILKNTAHDALSVSQLMQLADGVERTLPDIAALVGAEIGDIDKELRLAWRLMEFGATAKYGKFTLTPPNASDMSFNQAREIVMSILPDDLRKVSADQAQHRLTLRFDFPDVAQKRYEAQLAQAMFLTGWQIEVNPAVHQGALDTLARQLVPELNQVSLRLDQRIVEIRVDNRPDNWEAIQQEYLAQTGFQLQRKVVGAAETLPAASDVTPTTGHPIEINMAYAKLREALEPYTLYKTSLKQGGIVLSFITPEVGMRHQALIQQLAQQIGYPLSIHPHPNQQQIVQVVQTLCQAQGVSLRKNPSFQLADNQVMIEPTQPISETTVAILKQQFHEQTAYELLIK